MPDDPTRFAAYVTESPVDLAALDICGASSCLGCEPVDPNFPPLICTLPRGHNGMHHQDGVNCSWEIANSAWKELLS